MSKTLIHTSVRRVMLGRDTRGDISCGLRGQLKSVDYFRVEDFPEIADVYGLKPDMLIIYFPPGNIEDFFRFFKAEWNLKKKMARICDGVNYEVKYRQQVNGEWKEPKKDYPCDKNGAGCKCRATVSFTAFIAHPETLKVLNHIPIRFRTSSEFAGFHLLSNLELREKGLLGLPWMLSVKMREDGDKKYPVWNIEPGKHRNEKVAIELTGLGQLENGHGGLMLGEGKELTAKEREIQKFNEVVRRVMGLESLEKLKEYSAELAGEKFPFSEEYKNKVNQEFAEKKKEFTVPGSVNDILGSETAPDKSKAVFVKAEGVESKLMSDHIKKKLEDGGNLV